MALIEDAVGEITDPDAWQASMDAEEERKRALELAAEQWDDIAQRLLDEDGGA